jgi:hypothetical protein
MPEIRTVTPLACPARPPAVALAAQTRALAPVSAGAFSLAMLLPVSCAPHTLQFRLPLPPGCRMIAVRLREMRGYPVRVSLCVAMAAGLAVAACAGQTIKDKLPAYMGQPIGALIAKLGFPTRQDMIAGQTVYVWTVNGMQEGTSYGCTIRAIVDAQNVMTRWDFQGNEGACTRYAASLRN